MPPFNDEVTALPGWDGPLPSKIWSGYVPAGSDTQDGTTYVMHEHYTFVASENDPANDPVIVWTNGGPGASSLYGLFVEGIGPFSLNGASLATDGYNKTGVPTLFANPFSWTRLASVLIINSPPPVGYSYCEPAGPTAGPESCGSWNDTRTAIHNAAYLESFAAGFPEFLTPAHRWYLMGESYAGVYVPTLAQQLLANKSSAIVPNLAGFAVGDPCMGLDVMCGPGDPGPYAHVEFFHGHGQVSEKLYNKVMAACPIPNLQAHGCAGCSADCTSLLSEMDTAIAGYYAYNLYDTCWYENSFNPPHGGLGWNASAGRKYWGPPPLDSVPERTAFDERGRVVLDPERADELRFHAQVLQLQAQTGATASDIHVGNPGYACDGSTAMWIWVNNSAVKKAMHVVPDAHFFSGDNGAGFTYNLTASGLLGFLDHAANDLGLRVLVYNGDTDPGVNSFITQNWTTYVGMPELQPWRAWTLDGQQYVGGYVTRYKATGSFDFITIRGSGHMAPLFMPKATFSLVQSWLANEDWQHYMPPSQQR